MGFPETSLAVNVKGMVLRAVGVRAICDGIYHLACRIKGSAVSRASDEGRKALPRFGRKTGIVFLHRHWRSGIFRCRRIRHQRTADDGCADRGVWTADAKQDALNVGQILFTACEDARRVVRLQPAPQELGGHREPQRAAIATFGLQSGTPVAVGIVADSRAQAGQDALPSVCQRSIEFVSDSGHG